MIPSVVQISQAVAISFLAIIAVGCSKQTQTDVVYLNELNNCKPSPDNNDLEYSNDTTEFSFKYSSKWELDISNSVGGLDTMMFVNYSKIHTFRFVTSKSDLDTFGYFEQELNLMSRDSSVAMLSLGKFSIDNHEAFYAIVNLHHDTFPSKSTFIYTRTKQRVITIQLAIGPSEPTSSFCELMAIVNSVKLKD